jgi:hypothetical protein
MRPPILNLALLGAGRFHASPVHLHFLLRRGGSNRPRQVHGNLAPQDAAQKLTHGLVHGLAKQVEKALLGRRHGQPKILAGHLVIFDVDAVNQGFQIAHIFSNKERGDPAHEDGCVILDLLRLGNAHYAVRRCGANEEMLTGVQQLDGLDLDRRLGELVQIEERRFVGGSGKLRLAGGKGRGGKGGCLKETASIHCHGVCHGIETAR